MGSKPHCIWIATRLPSIINNLNYKPMKAIIFYCIDNFDKEYKYVVMCDAQDLERVIKQNYKCTEIIAHEVCNAYKE
jgi:hypothetical protein